MRSDNLVGNVLNQQCFVVTVLCATCGRYGKYVFLHEINDFFLLIKKKDL